MTSDSESALPYRIEQESTMGQLVVRRREALGWSRAYLARRSGLAASTVARLESGDTSVRLTTVCAVLVAIGARIDLVRNEDIGPSGAKPITVIREPGPSVRAGDECHLCNGLFELIKPRENSTTRFAPFLQCDTCYWKSSKRK